MNTKIKNTLKVALILSVAFVALLGFDGFVASDAGQVDESSPLSAVIYASTGNVFAGGEGDCAYMPPGSCH